MNLTNQVGICNLALARLGAKCDITAITGNESKINDVISASYDLVRDSMIAMFPWHFAIKRAELAYTVTTISNATQASPVVITVSDVTAFLDGCLAEITHVDGMTELNSNTFYLDGRNTTLKTTKLYDPDPAEQSDVSGTETINTHDPIDGTSYTAYTSDGQLRLVPYGYDYAYDLPSDCLAVIGLMGHSGDTYHYKSNMPFEINRDKLFTNLEDAFIEYTYQITDDSAPIFHALFIDAFAWRLAAEWAKKITDDIDVQGRMWEMYDNALREAKTNDAAQSNVDYSYRDSFLSSRL